MTKTQKQNARRSAKVIAKERGISYQQALDVVAQEAGYAHWSDMKAHLSQDASPMGILDLPIQYGWQRRGDSVTLLIRDEGTSVLVNRPWHNAFGPGLDAKGTEMLKAYLAQQHGINLERGAGKSVYSIELSGRPYQLPISVKAKEKHTELLIEFPSMNDRLHAKNPLSKEAIKAVGEVLFHCDHGLTRIYKGTQDQRCSAGEHLIKTNHMVGNIGLFNADEVEAAISHSQRWHALLLIDETETLEVERKISQCEGDIRFIAMIDLGQVPAGYTSFEKCHSSDSGLYESIVDYDFIDEIFPKDI